jgi:hypothetical protein
MIALLDPNDSRAFRNNNMSAMMRARVSAVDTPAWLARGRVLPRAASEASTGLACAKKGTCQPANFPLI